MNGGIQSNTVEDETGRVIYEFKITGVQLESTSRGKNRKRIIYILIWSPIFYFLCH